MRYICASRKFLTRPERPTQESHITSRSRTRRPEEKYIPKWTKDGRPNIRQQEETELDVNTTPGTKTTKSNADKSFWLKIGLIIAGVIVVLLVASFGICQIVMRRRNQQKRAKMIRNIARQKVEDDFMKKHLGPPTSWSFPSPVSSTAGDRMNMSESWIEPTDRFIMYDWPLRKSYHGDGLSSSLTRQKQQAKLEQSAIDATLPHFYHM